MSDRDKMSYMYIFGCFVIGFCASFMSMELLERREKKGRDKNDNDEDI